MPQLLRLRATTTEARVPRARAPQREATAMRSPRTATKSSPCLRQLKKARVQERKPNAAKNKEINLKKKKERSQLLTPRQIRVI